MTAVLWLPAAAQDAPAAASSYSAPERNRLVEAGTVERPLMTAIRIAAQKSVPEQWNKHAISEMGSGFFDSVFHDYFERERVQKFTDEFHEGYVQVFTTLPEVLILTGVEMETAETAEDLLRVQLEHHLIQLQATDEREDSAVEIQPEKQLALAGLDHAVERRFVLMVGDLPPSAYHVIFGRAGRFMVSVVLMQSKMSEENAHELMRSLATHVRETGGA